VISGAQIVSTAAHDGGGTVTITYDPATDTCPAPVTFGADAEIAHGGGAFVGLGVNNTTGAGQTRTAPVPFFGTATFTVRVHNTGSADDTIALRAPGSSPGYRVRYLDGSADVTAAVLAGTHTTGVLGPDGSDTLTIKVRPRIFFALFAPRLDLPVTATSLTDPDAVDVVVARARLRLFPFLFFAGVA
jgi:hypothetical protein